MASPARQSMTPNGVLTVSELLRSVRDALERRFPLLWVRGELSNLSRAPSGHCYFTLKDRGAQVDCVMYRSRAAAFDRELREGMQLEAQVLVSLYEPRGRFQLTVEALRPAGLGPLYERFLRLKERLEREGLFDPATKRALPPYPRTIGVITSRAAAALRDVLTTLARRNPAAAVIVYPAPVQGEGAAGRIAAMLAQANARAECDVLLLVRGGGSIEDLWCFNEESVAHAPRVRALPSRAPLQRAARAAAGLAHEPRSLRGARARLQHHAQRRRRSAARRGAGARGRGHPHHARAGRAAEQGEDARASIIRRAWRIACRRSPRARATPVTPASATARACRKTTRACGRWASSMS